MYIFNKCIKEIICFIIRNNMTKIINNIDSDTKPSRHLPDGKYNNKPLDEAYFRNYYQKNYSKEYTCLICGKQLNNIQKIKRHELSKFCLKARNTLDV